MTARVAWIAATPVKGLALCLQEEAMLTTDGIAGDRRFYLVTAEGRMANCKLHGPLQTIVPAYDPDAGTLALRFPDGSVASAAVELGATVVTDFFGRPVRGREVEGPWSEALSDFAGFELRLVRSDDEGAGVDRGREAGATLLSRESIARLAEVLGLKGPLDPRRFRMNVGVEGVAAHEEDTWLGRRVTVGDAIVVPHGNVGRCAVTRQHPATGLPDVDTLGGLTRYRGVIETTEPLPLGVWGEVVEAGRIHVGDAVSP